MDSVFTRTGRTSDRASEWPRPARVDHEEIEAGTAPPARTRGLGGSVFERVAGAAAAPARVGYVAPARQVDLDPGCLDSHLVAFTREDFAGAAEYDRLAVTVLLGAAERGFKRMLVASAGHGDGRTTVTLNLACALAAAQQSVLVVDADLERPSIGRMLGLEAEVGLTEALERGLPLEEAVVRANPYGVDFLPLRARVANPNQVLASRAFHEMLAAACQNYDIVLFDAPPLSDRAAMSLLVRLTETTLLVVRPGATSSAEMARAIAPLSEELLFGVVLNRAPR